MQMKVNPEQRYAQMTATWPVHGRGHAYNLDGASYLLCISRRHLDFLRFEGVMKIANRTFTSVTPGPRNTVFTKMSWFG